MGVKNRLVYRCRDCDRLRMPTPAESTRRGFRCLHCGGFLDTVGKGTIGRLDAFDEAKADMVDRMRKEQGFE